MPTLREWTAAQTAEVDLVQRQSTYLRNPLPPGAGICTVCRSSASEGFQLCYQCDQHRMEARGQLADVVAPISYAIKHTQHAHNLAVYKAAPPSVQAKRSLSSLAIIFIAYHWECLTAALGGPFTHMVTVPSTRARAGVHPLNSIVASRLWLPALNPQANPRYPAEDRRFHTDRFILPPGGAAGARVMLIDDTWTTGSRTQSLAFALKAAGATAVAAILLGRHVNPDYGPSKALVDRLRTGPDFDYRRCAFEAAPVW
ncbi:hypothetical protein [Actinoplanes sp. L3-i22]|uniref:hypothetical protein n=1 Tax=Actinoplanes sp. L3-i22 TaxID=2836373 RepID=UPI001C77842E|nr:hypothetical protein [Actinoplanes sp. L3-i22]BCY10909.1 hypothetical protein L3i22_059970 [Actinoplanes sp. L3-i22]